MRIAVTAGCLVAAVVGLAAVGGCGGPAPPPPVDATAEAADEQVTRREQEREGRHLKNESKSRPRGKGTDPSHD